LRYTSHRLLIVLERSDWRCDSCINAQAVTLTELAVFPETWKRAASSTKQIVSPALQALRPIGRAVATAVESRS
jgi:hypothetical protein